MKKIYNLFLAFVLAVGVLGLAIEPIKVEALGIDISKDQGNGSGYNPTPANNGQVSQNCNEVYTKLESIYYRNGVVSFNYAFTNFGTSAVTINKVRYEGVLSLNQNYYKFSSTGIVSNCYVQPNQTVRATLSFKDNRYGNYVGHLGSQGNSNTTWTNH